MNAHDKQRIALRYWLLGHGFHTAASAMTFAEAYHTGTRKDGVTPEFGHQVCIVSYLRTLLPHLRHGQEVLTAAFLHDVREDYDVSDAEIRGRFGSPVADSVDNMTKTFRGQRRDDVALFEKMADDPISSIVKAADRIHNQRTMVGVFSEAKIASYVQETTELFLPMLRAARLTFPDQEGAYENAKLVLNSQITLVSGFLDASPTAA